VCPSSTDTPMSLPFLADDDVLSVRWVWVVRGRLCYVCRHYTIALLVGSQTTDDVLPAIDSAITGQFRLCMSTEVRLHGVFARRIHPTWQDEMSQSALGGEPPFQEDRMLPNIVSSLVRLRGEFPGKRTTARVFLPGQPSRALTPEGLVSTTHLAELHGLGLLLVAPVPAFTFNGQCLAVPVIWHRDTQTTDTLHDVNASSRWTTQRRRGSPWHSTPEPI